MAKINYKQVFAKQNAVKKKLLALYPNLNEKSGIYIYTREEPTDDGVKLYAYIGQAKNLLSRLISHTLGYQQRIDISLKKRGLYNKDNPLGWKLQFGNVPLNQLDEKERYYIQQYQDKGFELYNITNGGQNEGKTDINERKATKTYRDGLKKKKKNTQKEIAHLFEKNLTYSINGTPNKNKEKAYEKFKKFIEGE